MKVLKFGGSSVGSAVTIGEVIEIVKKSIAKDRCAVVLSAMQGTTDALIEAGKLAESGDEGFREKITLIKNKHLTAINELFDEVNKTQITNFVQTSFGLLENICEGLFLLRELSPRTLDRIVSFGEILSTKIVAAKFDALKIENVWVDSRELIRTDSNFVNAAVDFPETNKQIKEFFKQQIQHSKSKTQNLFIFPGFIASDHNGSTTTLGRGGSDYTGAIIASAVEADVLEIWTDVSGMMTADPRFVRNVREIPHITYREAMELSHFGAKVIYPPTIQPVMTKGIPVLVKNTFAPDDVGTLIEAESTEKSDIIRGISSIDKICVLNLEGSGMVGIPGFSKRLFYALSKAKINVILITQSSSEHSICVAVEDKYKKLAKEVVDTEFEFEINVGKIEPLRVEKGLSILAVVGDNMKSHTGISGRMFSTLGHNGINIRAIAQGSSERNISAIIESKDVRKAINTLHEEFFSDGNKQINLFIAGVGTVGSRLLAQIQQQADYISENLRLNLRVVGLANSKKILFDESGLDLTNFASGISELGFEYDSNSSAIADLIIEENLRNSVFVDVTANAELVKTYPKLLEKSISIVACNKVAASSEYQKYQNLKDLAREYNTNFLFETNVGAGLPIINTLNDLTSSGDKINRIEAVLSGTLQFVFNNYDGSRPFSEVVKQAQIEGFTEPDPRLDLSGTDVARKILILAREAGYKLEMEEVEIKSFLPESCFVGSVEDFYTEMAKHEAHFKTMLDEAKSNNLILKYIASFDHGQASVSLQSIDSTHNFANLSGKDNAILLYTNRYHEQPLVVKGAGAGADVTAAGVFADIIRATRA
jgi:aspartokinase/homoserine dehydrogenase 1